MLVCYRFKKILWNTRLSEGNKKVNPKEIKERRKRKRIMFLAKLKFGEYFEERQVETRIKTAFLRDKTPKHY